MLVKKQLVIQFFCDFAKSANDNDDLQVQVTQGKFTAKNRDKIKGHDTYELEYIFGDNSAFKPETKEVIEDTFMNRYAISPVPPSNVNVLPEVNVSFEPLSAASVNDVFTASTYALIDCCVASCVAELELKSSSSNIAEPETAVFKTALVSVGAVSVLFVSVSVPVFVTTDESIATVTVVPVADVSIPVPPAIVSVSESKSMFNAPPESP